MTLPALPLTSLLFPPPDEELEPPGPEDSEGARSKERSGKSPPYFGQLKGPPGRGWGD